MNFSLANCVVGLIVDGLPCFTRIGWGGLMSCKEILEQALKIKPDERFMALEGIIKSLDEPDRSLDAIWVGEAEKRLEAYRADNLEVIPVEEIFREEQ